MPLDLSERMRVLFEKEASLQQGLVAYRLLPGTRANYRLSRFPFSVGQPLRSMARVMSNMPRDSLEAATTQQVTAYLEKFPRVLASIRRNAWRRCCKPTLLKSII